MLCYIGITSQAKWQMSARCWLSDGTEKFVLVYGKFSIMKGWRFFFFLFTQWWVFWRKFCHYFPSLFCNPEMDLFKFFQLNRVPKKSGMGVNSSNVDKRTRLIPCRCVSGLCEGTLCCPHWREKGLCMEKVQWITSEKHQWPSTAGSVWLSGFPGKRKEATQKHKHVVFTLWRSCVYVSYPQSKNTITCWSEKVHP